MFEALNHEIGLSTRSTSANGTNGKATPFPANYQLCELEMPAGENYTIGSRYELLTNETYDWVYNSNGVNFIKRINNKGICEIVYHGCLELSADPKHSMEDWRAYMRIEKVCPNRDGKYLVWTDGTDFGIGHLDVEAAIATNFFTTPFFHKCAPDPCDFVKLCVPEICGCIQAEYITLPQGEVGLSNQTLDKGFKFMIKHVSYDGRESEWSDRSTLYYQTTKNCFNNGIGLSRCLKLRIPVGNPTIEKIKIAFSDNGGLTWFITETVEKYKKYNNLQQKWYERELSDGLLNFSEEDCSFDYIFCNNKERIQVAEKEISRVRNPIPRNAQGFIQIKDSIGLYNFIDGVCPLDKKETEKIKIELDCATADTDCSSEFVTVTVRALIHSVGGSERSQPVYRQGGAPITNLPDDPEDVAYFGGVKRFIPIIADSQNITYSQQFNGKVRNFLPYIEGTSFYSEMKQWTASKGFTNRKQIGVISGINNILAGSRLLTFTQDGSFYYQEAKFKVVKGTKGFIRLPSHSQTTGAGSAQNTSTTVIGIFNDIKTYNGNSTLLPFIDTTKKEIYFDTCNGDVDLEQAFVVQDIAFGGAYAAYNGYITDKSGFPVEGANIYSGSILSTTDHNGFYFLVSTSTTISAEIRVELDCAAFHNVQTMTLEGEVNQSNPHNEKILSDVYNTQFHLDVLQKLIDCNGNGIPGIRIAISGSKSRSTDADGIAHLRIRNYSTRNRTINTVVMNENGCFTIDCNGSCNPCMPTNTTLAPSCFTGAPTAPILTLLPLTVNRESLLTIINGLKSGGRYPFAVVAQGDCGRMSAAYFTNYLDIPRTQEKNKLNFCKFKFSSNGATFPDWVTCLKVVRGLNENPFELQWIVDKFEQVGDGKIKITIQSLNDYNQKYFFQSNTVYQWLKGDRIEFISNGDGKILTTADHGLLNYLTVSPFHDTLISGLKNADANYFNQLIIEDDGRLGDITEGAIIELQRPSQSIGETLYKEICVTIPVENGVPELNSVEFKTFDTYIINRTSGSFLGYFESKYPSDFWGKTTDGFGLDDTGKVHIVNQYETEKRYGRNISLNSPTVFNYFGDIIKRFDSPEHGDIIAMYISDAAIIIAIGEHDSFLAQTSNDLMRVASDGTVHALPPDAIISDTQPKERGQFGCQYDSIGSVYFGDGYATWVDKNKAAWVKHDYSEAKDVSMGQMQTFMRKKCQDISNKNMGELDFLHHYKFISGYNKNTGAIILTIKKLRDSGINNSPDAYELPNVTMLYHPVADIFLSRAGYTAESYSMINLSDKEGCAFISFLNGVPYIHPKISNKYLEFFGVTVDWMVGVSLNQFPEKDKTPLSFELQSIPKWFVSRVTTENVNFISEIPPVRVKKSLNKWNGAFLKNNNSRGGLFNGDVASSYSIDVLFIRDNTIKDQYGTIDIEKRLAYSELSEIYFKFMVNEQSGFQNNL